MTAGKTMERRIWRGVVKLVGGVHMIGRLWIIIHDHGLSIAWRQIEKFDWRL
jgi:hypothetical protein